MNHSTPISKHNCQGHRLTKTMFTVYAVFVSVFVYLHDSVMGLGSKGNWPLQHAASPSVLSKKKLSRHPSLRSCGLRTTAEIGSLQNCFTINRWITDSKWYQHQHSLLPCCLQPLNRWNNPETFIALFVWSPSSICAGLKELCASLERFAMGGICWKKVPKYNYMFTFEDIVHVQTSSQITICFPVAKRHLFRGFRSSLKDCSLAGQSKDLLGDVQLPKVLNHIATILNLFCCKYECRILHSCGRNHHRPCQKSWPMCPIAQAHWLSKLRKTLGRSP